MEKILSKFAKNLNRNFIIEEYLIEKGFKNCTNKKPSPNSSLHVIGMKEFVLFYNYKQKNKVPMIKVSLDTSSFFVYLSFYNISSSKLAKFDELNIPTSYDIHQRDSNYIQNCFDAIDNLMKLI